MRKEFCWLIILENWRKKALIGQNYICMHYTWTESTNPRIAPRNVQEKSVVPPWRCSLTQEQWQKLKRWSSILGELNCKFFHIQNIRLNRLHRTSSHFQSPNIPVWKKILNEKGGDQCCKRLLRWRLIIPHPGRKRGQTLTKCIEHREIIWNENSTLIGSVLFSLLFWKHSGPPPQI